MLHVESTYNLNYDDTSVHEGYAAALLPVMDLFNHHDFGETVRVAVSRDMESRFDLCVSIGCVLSRVCVCVCVCVFHDHYHRP